VAPPPDIGHGDGDGIVFEAPGGSDDQDVLLAGSLRGGSGAAPAAAAGALRGRLGLGQAHERAGDGQAQQAGKTVHRCSWRIVSDSVVALTRVVWSGPAGHADDSGDGFEQFAGADGLGDVAIHSGCQAALAIALHGVGGEGQNRGVPAQGFLATA